jgi:hypothetical protein
MVRTILVMTVATALATGAGRGTGEAASASFRLDDGRVGAGGRPAGGTMATSPSFRISVEALGEPILAPPGHRAGAGFLVRYLPPTEVTGLAFASPVELTWAASPRAIEYDLYREALSKVAGGQSRCFASGIAETSLMDADAPGPGEGFFYLVTGRNRLGEPGTHGTGTDGQARTAAPACP